MDRRKLGERRRVGTFGQRFTAVAGSDRDKHPQSDAALEALPKAQNGTAAGDVMNSPLTSGPNFLAVGGSDYPDYSQAATASAQQNHTAISGSDHAGHALTGVLFETATALNSERASIQQQLGVAQPAQQRRGAAEQGQLRERAQQVEGRQSQLENASPSLHEIIQPPSPMLEHVQPQQQVTVGHQVIEAKVAAHAVVQPHMQTDGVAHQIIQSVLDKPQPPARQMTVSVEAALGGDPVGLADDETSSHGTVAARQAENDASPGKDCERCANCSLPPTSALAPGCEARFLDSGPRPALLARARDRRRSGTSPPIDPAIEGLVTGVCDGDPINQNPNVAFTIILMDSQNRFRSCVSVLSQSYVGIPPPSNEQADRLYRLAAAGTIGTNEFVHRYCASDQYYGLRLDHTYMIPGQQVQRPLFALGFSQVPITEIYYVSNQTRVILGAHSGPNLAGAIPIENDAIDFNVDFSKYDLLAGNSPTSRGLAVAIADFYDVDQTYVVVYDKYSTAFGGRPRTGLVLLWIPHIDLGGFRALKGDALRRFVDNAAFSCGAAFAWGLDTIGELHNTNLYEIAVGPDQGDIIGGIYLVHDGGVRGIENRGSPRGCGG